MVVIPQDRNHYQCNLYLFFILGELYHIDDKYIRILTKLAIAFVMGYLFIRYRKQGMIASKVINIYIDHSSGFLSYGFPNAYK